MMHDTLISSKKRRRKGQNTFNSTLHSTNTCKEPRSSNIFETRKLSAVVPIVKISDFLSPKPSPPRKFSNKVSPRGDRH